MKYSYNLRYRGLDFSIWILGEPSLAHNSIPCDLLPAHLTSHISIYPVNSVLPNAPYTCHTLPVTILRRILCMCLPDESLLIL